jgi:hypothetical protein
MKTDNLIAHVIHMRCYKDDDRELSDPLPNGGATIAWTEIPTEDEDHCLVHIAIARCHDNDNYNRKVGRAVAIGKLNHDECFPLLIDVDQLDAVYDLIVEFANTQMDTWEAQHAEVIAQREAAAEVRRLKREQVTMH